MRLGFGRALAAALVVLGIARHAPAQVPALPVALDFHADAACPDATHFLARIHARAPLRSSNEPDALRLSVTLSVKTGGFRGQLRAGEGDGSETREVDATTCEEVADALALIGALIVERSKREHAEHPPPPVRPPASNPPSARASAPPPRRRATTLGAEALMLRPMTSAPLAGAAVSLFVEGYLSWWLSAGYARNDIVGTPRSIRLGYGAVGLGIGPPSLRLASRVRLAGALAAEGGFVAAEGVDVDVPASVRRSYWALGLLARLQWQMVDHGYLFMQGAGLIPLVERGFSTREPYERVATTAIVAPKLGVGIGLGF